MLDLHTEIINYGSMSFILWKGSEVSSIIFSNIQGIKGERPGLSPRGLHRTEIKSPDFIEIGASLKSRKLSLYDFIIRNMNK
jgi:hypothetical protein